MWCHVMSCFVDSAGPESTHCGSRCVRRVLLYWLFPLLFVSQGPAQLSGQRRNSFPPFTSYDSFFSTYNFFHIISMQFGVLRLVLFPRGFQAFWMLKGKLIFFLEVLGLLLVIAWDQFCSSSKFVVVVVVVVVTHIVLVPWLLGGFMCVKSLLLEHLFLVLG